MRAIPGGLVRQQHISVQILAVAQDSSAYSTHGRAPTDVDGGVPVISAFGLEKAENRSRGVNTILCEACTSPAASSPTVYCASPQNPPTDCGRVFAIVHRRISAMVSRCFPSRRTICALIGQTLRTTLSTTGTRPQHSLSVQLSRAGGMVWREIMVVPAGLVRDK